MKIKKTL